MQCPLCTARPVASTYALTSSDIAAEVNVGHVAGFSKLSFNLPKLSGSDKNEI